MKPKAYWKTTAFRVLAGFALWSCFYGLGTLPVRLWDESRQAINSLEMLQSGQYGYSTFDGMPDFYNTKPPLLIWLQTLSGALFGFSEWSLRLPSALAGVCTGLLVFVFVFRNSDSEAAALLAGVSLMAAPGWIDEHVARTGDYDALLTLWLCAAMCAYYRFERESHPGSAHLFLLFTFLAVATKSTAGLMFLPGIFIWSISTGALKKLLRVRGFLLLSAGMLLLLSAWYAVHESLTPGYLRAVWNNEVSARFVQPSEGHSGPWYYYLLQLALTDFPWWPLAIAGFLASLLLLRSRLAGFIAWQLTAFLALLSIGATKIEWYAAPALPLLAMGTGILLLPAGNARIRNSILAASLLSIMALWSQQTLNRITKPIELQMPGPEDELSLYLQGRHSLLRPDTAFRVITADYNPTVLVYTRMPDRRFHFSNLDWRQLDSSEKVIAWHAHQLDSLKTWYPYRLLSRSGHLHFIEIQGRKRSLIHRK